MLSRSMTYRRLGIGAPIKGPMTGVWIPHHINALWVRSRATTYPSGLIAREVELLRLVAEQFVISPHTVNTHLTSFYNKLGVDSRAAVTCFAVKQRHV